MVLFLQWRNNGKMAEMGSKRLLSSVGRTKAQLFWCLKSEKELEMAKISNYENLNQNFSKLGGEMRKKMKSISGQRERFRATFSRTGTKKITTVFQKSLCYSMMFAEQRMAKWLRTICGSTTPKPFRPSIWRPATWWNLTPGLSLMRRDTKMVVSSSISLLPLTTN